MRQGRARATQNRTQRSQLRTALKRVRTATGAEAQAAYADAVKLLDRAGQKNIIHKNAAARQKSRLAKLVGTKAGENSVSGKTKTSAGARPQYPLQQPEMTQGRRPEVGRPSCFS